jgi:formate dehydrogenase major subunit
LPAGNKGVFSGLIDGKYEKDTWSYQIDADDVIKKDKTLKDQYCVYQLLEKHFYVTHRILSPKLLAHPKKNCWK